MTIDSQNAYSRRPGLRRRTVALALGVVLVAVACGGSDSVDLAAADAIETNDGNILVKPPDVLDGDPEPTRSPIGDLPPPVEGLQPTPELDFVYFDGSPGSTTQLQGTPTVINFWASNCPACVAEMPDFEEVFQARGNDVAFLGVNTADVSREAAVALAERTGVTYRLVDDSTSEIFRSFGGFVMPTTVLLNAQGQVAYVWSGVLTSGELDRLITDHIALGSS